MDRGEIVKKLEKSLKPATFQPSPKAGYQPNIKVFLYTGYNELSPLGTMRIFARCFQFVEYAYPSIGVKMSFGCSRVHSVFQWVPSIVQY